MPDSATQPQSDTPADTQPVISEPLPPQEPPPPARWRVSRSALLLIGGPLAGALLVWLAISIFSADPSTPPEAVTTTAPADVTTAPPAAVAEQPASEPAFEGQPVPVPADETQPAPEPAIEEQPAMEPSVANSAAEAEPAPVAPEPSQQSDGSTSAINEVTPKVPQSALDTIRGTVRVSVRVTINKEGAVVDATANDPGPSRYFERLSIDAARKWTFASATSEEQRTMLVKFNFTREGVTARAEPDAE